MSKNDVVINEEMIARMMKLAGTEHLTKKFISEAKAKAQSAANLNEAKKGKQPATPSFLKGKPDTGAKKGAKGVVKEEDKEILKDNEGMIDEAEDQLTEPSTLENEPVDDSIGDGDADDFGGVSDGDEDNLLDDPKPALGGGEKSFEVDAKTFVSKLADALLALVGEGSASAGSDPFSDSEGVDEFSEESEPVVEPEPIGGEEVEEEPVEQTEVRESKLLRRPKDQLTDTILEALKAKLGQKNIQNLKKTLSESKPAPKPAAKPAAKPAQKPAVKPVAPKKK